MTVLPSDHRAATASPPAPPTSTPAAAEPLVAHPGAARTARVMSWVLVALLAGTAAAGLWVPDLYQDPVVVAAQSRGADLISLLVVPLLAWSTWAAGRDSALGTLTWLSALTYLVYAMPFMVFGAAFNDAFVAHMAVFALALYGLVLALVSLDAHAVAARFAPRTPARWVAALLLLLALMMIGLWGWSSIRWSLTGAPPTEAFPVPIERVHLGYVMDAAVLAPACAIAGLLLWQRRAWGYVLGTAVMTAVAAFQITYTSMQAFIHAADVPGVAAVDWAYLPFVAVMVAAAGAMLRSARSRRGRPSVPTRATG